MALSWRRPLSSSDDGYGRPGAVRWLSLPQLVRTGFMVAQARSFALFTDQRESMAGSPRELYRLQVRRPAPKREVKPDPLAMPAPERDPAVDEAVWVDYVSDTGDGFRATFATGRCISGGVTVPAQSIPAGLTPEARAEAELAAEMFDDRPRHADLLVLGGDEVYPVGSPKNYRERLNNVLRIVGQLDVVNGQPPVAALPGNHDWYDGLASFRRNFCESQLNRNVQRGLHALPEDRDAVGAWGAFQSRSYFAVKLGPGWWLWAVDSQLDAPIDMEQLSYFREAAEKVRQGDDRIILCTAGPSWLEAESQDAYLAGPDTPFHTLLWFIARVLGPDADRIRLILTGDQHYYARHVSIDRPDADPVLVTCGGGGAFLSSTHHLGDEISFDSRPWEPVQEEKVSGAKDLNETTGPAERGRAAKAPPKIRSYRLETSYPDRDRSRSLHLQRFLSAAVRNGGSLPLAIGLADAALLIFLVPNLWAPFGQSWAAPKPLSGVTLTIVGLLLWIYALSGTKDFPKTRVRRTAVLTVGHTSAHVVLAWGVAYLAMWAFKPDPGTPTRLVQALGGLTLPALGMLVFVTYLYLADRFLRCHTLEAFSGMRIEDYKCHLRLRVHPQRVDVWVVGMAKVPSLEEVPNDKLDTVPLKPVVVEHFTVPRGADLPVAPGPAAPAVPAPAPPVEPPPAEPEPARTRRGAG